MGYLVSFGISTNHFFRDIEPKIDRLQTSTKPITQKYRAYGEDGAALLVAFLNRPTLNCSLFHEIYRKLRIRVKEFELLGFTTNCCSPRKVYSGFNTVFLPLLLLAAGVGFPAACF